MKDRQSGMIAIKSVSNVSPTFQGKYKGTNTIFPKYLNGMEKISTMHCGSMEHIYLFVYSHGKQTKIQH